MAAPLPGVWGIDVGQCALKAIRLELKDGQVIATAFDYIEHPKILSQPDADPDQLTREALEQFLSRNTIRGDLVVISVPGQSGLARFVKLPPVEEKKIADIVKFEAKQQIPFPLEEVVWDFQKLSRASVTGDYVETEIGLFAMKRDLVFRALMQFKEAGVEVHVVQMAPLALCNFIAYDLLGRSPDGIGAGGEEESPADAKSCVVALDVGTDNSNLVITDGDKIIWQRPIPLGGNHFTRALTKDLKLTFAKAEHLKRNAAKSPDLKKILASLKSVLNDFVGEVQRSLGYFTNTHRDAQIQYMIGLGNACRLPGLQKFLQEKLQLEVRKMTVLEKATGDAVTAAPTFTENVMGFAVAYGLALQGLKLTRLQTNLLPYEVRLERLIRAKKPWALASAACILLGVAGLAFSKGIEKSAITKPDIKAQQSRADAKQKEIQANNVAIQREKEEQVKAIETLRRIGAGVKERFNWQLLHQYVNMALPLPNGDRLTTLSNKNERVKALYWDNKKEAQKAFRDLEALRFKQANELAADKQKEQEEYIKKNLIQVNIEGVSAMWADDLAPYFRKVASDTPILFGMYEQEKNLIDDFIKKGGGAIEPAPPDKPGLPPKGWVIEVRGYTYHWDDLKFIENTIIENLKYPGNIGKLTPEMDDLIRNRVGFLFIYTAQQVKNPEPGKFVYIAQSYLPMLVAGGTALGGAPPGPGADPSAGPVPGGGLPTVNRGDWKPIGEVAQGGSAGFGGPAPPIVQKGSFGIGSFGDPRGAGPGGFKKEEPVAVAAQPRTEFVVLFVWREPLPESADPAAGAIPGAVPGAPPK